MDSVKPAGSAPVRASRNHSAYFVAAAPVLFLLGAAVLWRGFQQTSRPNNSLTSGGVQTYEARLHSDAASARALAPSELRVLVAEREEIDRAEAYEAAQKLVKQFLLTREKSIHAQFPSQPTSRDVTIEKRSPTFFRVRATVEWQPGGDPSLPPHDPQRFEADLRHGPTDKEWHLVDTEFLNAPPPQK